MLTASHPRLQEPVLVEPRYCPVCTRLIQRREHEHPSAYRRGKWRFCCNSCFAKGQRQLRVQQLRQAPAHDPLRPVDPKEIRGLDRLPKAWPGDPYWIWLWLGRIRAEMPMSVPTIEQHRQLPMDIAAGELGAVTVLNWQFAAPWEMAA